MLRHTSLVLVCALQPEALSIPKAHSGAPPSGVPVTGAPGLDAPAAAKVELPAEGASKVRDMLLNRIKGPKFKAMSLAEMNATLGEAMRENNRQLAMTLGKKGEWADDWKQKDMIESAIKGNDKLKETAAQFSDDFNMNVGLLSDIKKNYDMQTLKLNEWRVDSSKAWQNFKRKMTAVLEELQGKEDERLTKIGDNLFGTFRAIQSMFGYQVQKYAFIKNTMLDLQRKFSDFEKMADKSVNYMVGIIDNQASAANDRMRERSSEAADFYDAHINNMYHNLRSRMDRNEARIQESNKFMNQVFWDGGAEIPQSPAPAPKLPDKPTWYGGPRWGPSFVQSPRPAPAFVENALEEHHAPADDFIQLDHDRKHHVDEALYQQPGVVGAAARAYNALGDELEGRMAPAKLGLNALVEEGDASLDHALQGKFFAAVGEFFEDVIGLRGRRRRGHLVPRPPIKIPKLIGILEDVEKKADAVEEKVVDKTKELEMKMGSLEKLEGNREKDFMLTHNAAWREVDNDRKNREEVLDHYWEKMLEKHTRALLALETDVVAAVAKVKEENGINYAIDYQKIASNKKLRVRELGELRRELNQIARRVESTLQGVKEGTGAMRVDVAKGNTEMNTAAMEIQGEAKSTEKETTATIKSKFDGINAEIQRAVVNDVQQVTQYNSQLGTVALNYANDGKQKVEALKKELIALETQHQKMFAESEAWIQNFNDGLMELGNQVHSYMRQSVKDVQTLQFDLDTKRRRNADSLNMQVNMLNRAAQTAMDKIHGAEMKGLDSQFSIESKAQDALKTAILNDEIATDTSNSVADRTMKAAEDFITTTGRRHDQKLAAAGEQLKALQDQIPSMQQEADAVTKKVADAAKKIADKREKIVADFGSNIKHRYGQAMTTADAQITVDAKTAQRDLGTAVSKLESQAATAADGVQGTLGGLAQAQAAFDTKAGQAQNKIQQLHSKEAQVSSAMTGAVSALKQSLDADVEGEAALKGQVQDELTSGTQRLRQRADQVLRKISVPEQEKFAKDLEAEEARVDEIVKMTQYTFGEKQRLIHDVNSKILQQIVAVEQENEVTAATMAQVADDQRRTDAAAAAAEQHASEEAGQSEAAAAAATEAMDDERLSTEEKLKRAVRAQGHVATQAMDAAVAKVASDADAAVEAIRNQEHLDEEEKKRRIAKVEAAARAAVAQMADTEAAAGRGLTAYELITTKWNGNLAEHIDELDDILQAEDLHRTRTLASAKGDLASMSETFHGAVVDVKAAVEKAVSEGKIVLTADQMNRLHQMEADAHDRMTVHKTEAQKELRIAALLEDRVSRAGEMTEEELANLERKLSLLTGTVSGGVSSLQQRTTDSSRARDKALRAQNHFAAASVGQALSAVSKMAEFLVAATRVSGLKQQALLRQQQRLAEVLNSPLANLQEELKMKDSKITKNEMQLEEEEKQAKQWGDDFGGKLMQMQAENAKQLKDAQDTVDKMPSEVAGQLSDVEAHATAAMQHGTDEIDKMASFDAAKSKHQISEILQGDEQFEHDLAARAKNTVGLATDQIDKIKFDQYNKFMEMDANDDKLAENIEKLKAKSDSMIHDAQSLSARVAAAINKQVMVAEEKRAVAGKELNQLNARANAMAGNDPALSAASLAQIKHSLLQAPVSDAALEQLAAALEQHNAQEARHVATAEQLNAEVRQQLTA